MQTPQVIQVEEKDRLIDQARAERIWREACRLSGCHFELTRRQVKVVVLVIALVRQLGLTDVCEVERRMKTQLDEYKVVLPDEVLALIGPYVAHGGEWSSKAELDEIFTEGLAAEGF